MLRKHILNSVALKILPLFKNNIILKLENLIKLSRKQQLIALKKKFLPELCKPLLLEINPRSYESFHTTKFFFSVTFSHNL
jgi:hypothetical protein